MIITPQHPIAIHPGLSRNFSVNGLKAFGVIDEKGDPILDLNKQQKTIAQGAATGVWFATNPQLNDFGGVYGENCNISPIISADDNIDLNADILPAGVMPYAVDPLLADQLWTLSEKMTGLTLIN